MSPRGLVAASEIAINAPTSEVWKALTDPEIIRQYFLGTEVVTDWEEGSQIVWKGVWQGKPYQDKGKIVTFVPEKKLVVTHWSPLSGVPDIPENQHTVSYELSFVNGVTHIVLTQDNNASEEEKKHSEGMWTMMLQNMKKTIEK